MKNLTVSVLLILYCYGINAQTEWSRWEAKQIDYKLALIQNQDIENDAGKVSNSAVSFLRDCYSFFISDLDGDNCPFTPSCSRFFVQAVEETNLFKGFWMFADRFTRDLNFLKGYSNYPIKNGKFFDPPGNYALNLR